MSSTSSQALNQTKVSGRIVHPIQQSVARRAEYPHSLKRGVRLGSPGTIAAMLWPVSDIKNPILATGLTSARRLWVTGVEALQVAVRAALLSRLGMVLPVFLRSFRVELGPRLPRALDGALWRTVPFVTFATPFRKKLCPALAAMTTGSQQFARFPIITKFLLAGETTELLPSCRGLKSGAALAAMFGSLHV
jgi:hypothetical protein